jgi:hypothetical protein
VHGAKSMMEARVMRPRINQLCKPHLFDAPKSLEIRVIDDVENQLISDGDEPVDRIIDNLPFVQVLCFNSLKFELLLNFDSCKDTTFYGLTMRSIC